MTAPQQPQPRRCVWCRRILDRAAPHTGTDERVRPHCPDSHTCTWCLPCVIRRTAVIREGLRPVDPDQMT